MSSATETDNDGSEQAPRAVQAVLEIDDAAPLHRVGEKVSVEGGVLRQQAVQGQHGRGGDEFIQTDLLRRDLRPVPVGQPVLGIRAKPGGVV